MHLHLSKAISGVSVRGLRVVDRQTTLVTKVGSTSNSTARIVVTIDACYFSETNLMLFEDALLNRFMATQKMKHGEVLSQVWERIPQDMTPKVA